MNGDHDDIIRLDEPLTYGEARQATTEMARLCRAAGDDLDKLIDEWEEAEADYRKTYGEAIRELRAGGESTTLIEDIAKGREAVAERLAKREALAKRVRSQVIRCNQLDGERALLRQIVEWSQHALDPSGSASRVSPQVGERHDGISDI